MRQQKAALNQEVSRIPANLRAAAFLTAFKGLSQHEASEFPGVSINAIETRTRQANRAALLASVDKRRDGEEDLARSADRGRWA